MKWTVFGQIHVFYIYYGNYTKSPYDRLKQAIKPSQTNLFQKLITSAYSKSSNSSGFSPVSEKLLRIFFILCYLRFIKAAAPDIRYFAKSKFFKSCVHKKIFNFIKILIFWRRGRIPLLTLNEFGEKSRVTIILGNFVNIP